MDTLLSSRCTRTFHFTSVLAAVLTTLYGSTAHGQAAATSDPRDDASPWGMTASAEWSGEYPRFNPLLKDAGVKWLRLFPEWQGLEKKQGEFNWDTADKMVANAKENGIRISGTFGFLASWASANGGTRRFPIKDMQYWRDYVKAVVGRYKGDIKYWEVWNEFNGSFSENTTAKDYANLIVATSEEARKIDPEVKLGLAVANFHVGYIDQTILEGAAGHFDFVTVHPYENLAAAMNGGEMGYLTMAGSLRKVLTAHKQKVDMPLWITETGIQAPIAPDAEADARQADAMVKTYVLPMAQGFSKIMWFEARGPAYGKGTDHGMIRKDWSLRPAYHTLKTMTTLMGAEPKYLGWLNIGGSGYGFVFAGAEQKAVLVTWAVKGTTPKAVFKNKVQVVSLVGESSDLAANEGLPLTTSSLFITGISDELVAEAKGNVSKPYPWGKDYATSNEVAVQLGATNVPDGLDQFNSKTTEIVQGLDWSARRTNKKLKGGEGNYVYFRVDPSFAGYGTKELEVTIVARRDNPEKPAGMNLTYEGMKGYGGSKDGWFTLPAGTEWSEHTWKITDANFVGAWGWNFRADASGSPTDFQIREVRVKKVGTAAVK